MLLNSWSQFQLKLGHLHAGKNLDKAQDEPGADHQDQTENGVSEGVFGRLVGLGVASGGQILKTAQDKHGKNRQDRQNHGFIQKSGQEFFQMLKLGRRRVRICHSLFLTHFKRPVQEEASVAGGRRNVDFEDFDAKESTDDFHHRISGGDNGQAD